MAKPNEMELITEGPRMTYPRLAQGPGLPESEEPKRLHEALSIGREWLAHLLFGVRWQGRRLAECKPVFWLALDTEPGHLFDLLRVGQISDAGPTLREGHR